MDKNVRILCYGDSNTYGYIPGVGERYSEDIRWTGRLAQMLGEGYEVIEEGLNSRTTVYDDLFEEGKNGLETLIPTLEKHGEVDVVIIFLGSNDLKGYFRATTENIASNAGQLVDVVRDYYGDHLGSSRIILVSPPEITRAFPGSNLPEKFWTTTIEKSRELHTFFELVAKEKGCSFIDAASVAKPSDVDGLHFDEAAHALMADAMYKCIIAITK